MQNLSMLIIEQMFCCRGQGTVSFSLCSPAQKLRGTPHPTLPIASVGAGHVELFTLLHYLYFQIVLRINCY